MDCLEFEAQLDAVLDQRLDPRIPALQEHAETCLACRESLNGAIRVLRGVKAWRKTVPAVNLVDQVELSNRASVTQQSRDVTVRKREERPLGGVFSWSLAAVTAAAICLMFWAAPFPNGSRSSQRGVAKSGPVKPQAETLTPAPKHLEPANFEIVLASAEGAYSHLAEESVAVAQDFALLMPSSGLFRATDSPSKATQSSPSSMNGLLPTNVYPVGDSVENALQFLWQAVPSSEKSS